MGNFLGVVWILITLFAAWWLMPFSRRVTPLQRVGCLVILALIFAIPSIRFFAGWSLALPYQPVFEMASSLLAFILLLIAFWVFAEEGVMNILGPAISVMVIVVLIATPAKAVFIPILGELFSGSYLAVGYVDSTTSYQLFNSRALLGGVPYTSYAIYKNPAWFPVVHRLLTNGALYSKWKGGVRFGVCPSRDSRSNELQLCALP